VFGAVAGGARLDDPACDLAVAAAVASAIARVPAPTASAFVGEIGLTGVVRPAPGMGARLSAARAAGLHTVFVPEGAQVLEGFRPVPVRHVMQALTWAAARPTSVSGPRPLGVPAKRNGPKGG
jgi:DNA repair protein RadA/Sms